MLKDVDYGALVIDHARPEAERLAAKAGVSVDSLRGSVRSLTFRARKPGAVPAIATPPEPKAACCGPTCCS